MIEVPDFPKAIPTRNLSLDPYVTSLVSFRQFSLGSNTQQIEQEHLPVLKDGSESGATRMVEREKERKDTNRDGLE